MKINEGNTKKCVTGNSQFDLDLNVNLDQWSVLKNPKHEAEQAWS